MLTIIDKLTVAIRKSDSCGYAIPCESSHTVKYKHAVDRITKWAGKDVKLIDIENKPIKGFKLSSAFRRYGYFGSGNAIFRIADPRGFELELYQESFAKLLTDITMINGEIQDECYWSKHGSAWVLIPLDSDVHKQYLKEKDVHVMETLTPSQITKLPHGTKLKIKEHNKLLDIDYYGTVYSYTVKNVYSRSRYSSEYNTSRYEVKLVKRHLVDRHDSYRRLSLETSLHVVSHSLPNEPDTKWSAEDYRATNIKSYVKNSYHKKDEYWTYGAAKYHNAHTFVTGKVLNKNNTKLEMVEVERLPEHYQQMLRKCGYNFIRQLDYISKRTNKPLIIKHSCYEVTELTITGLEYQIVSYGYERAQGTAYKPGGRDAYLLDAIKSKVTHVLCIVSENVIIPVGRGW